MYPIHIVFTDNEGQEAHGRRLPSGKWLIDWCRKRCVETMVVDDMPEHWIEQLRRWSLLARRMP